MIQTFYSRKVSYAFDTPLFNHSAAPWPRPSQIPSPPPFNPKSANKSFVGGKHHSDYVTSLQ